jgi:A/G-specific adenine glycosylase
MKSSKGAGPSKPDLADLRRRLLAWYDRHRRDLPWRRTRDPYAIWVAETMLQRTQVRSVLPYYRRFLERFPDLRALAGARRGQVLALWSGLGYYRRAENLHAAARRVVAEHGGVVPRRAAELRSLPGVGDYTVGAVMSIAFGEPHVALDSNARRVTSRLFGVAEEGAIREAAGRLLSRRRPGDFNQALMELGSLVCLPRRPRCGCCPAARHCSARSDGRFSLGRTNGAPRRKNVVWPLALCFHDGRVLLRRRPAGGLLSGMWELPGGEKRPGESARACLARELGVPRLVAEPAGEVRHAITYRRIRAPLFRVAVGGSRFGLPFRWVSVRALGRYPLSALAAKALEREIGGRVGGAAGRLQSRGR